MEMPFTILELKAFVLKQLDFFGGEISDVVLSDFIDMALQRTEYCFSQVNNKYYSKDGKVFFSPLHTAQYATFLYYLSNTAYLNDDLGIAEKVYYLNKMLNSVDWFYEVELPSVFMSDHAMGSVLGRATYEGGFVITQGCTVGQNKGVYPVLGDGIVMHPYSMVIGDSKIGNNVEISSYVMIRDAVIPSNCIVFGQSPSLKIVQKSEKEMHDRIPFFKH